MTNIITKPITFDSSKLRKITLADYYKALLRADWFYHYSDCYETRSRAVKSIALLEKIGTSHPIANKMWRDCKEYVGKRWSDPDTKVFDCPKINAEFSYLAIH